MGRIIKPFEPIPDIVGLKELPDYEITREGRVFKKAIEKEGYNMKRFEVKTFADHKSGSCRVLLKRNGKRYSRGVADLMVQAFYPAPRVGSFIEIYFRDKDPFNCSIDNLKVFEF